MSLNTPILTFAFGGGGGDLSGIIADIAAIEAILLSYSAGVSGGTW